MKKIFLIIVFCSSISFGQTLDTIRKIEIYYGYGAQCFPRDGIYAREERFVFNKCDNGDFELSAQQKRRHISKQNATVFSKDSSTTNLNKKCNSKILLDFIKSLNENKQNFSLAFLNSKIDKPSKHKIKMIARKMDKFYLLECYGFLDCEHRNKIIDSIQKFNHFDQFVSSMNLTNNQMILIGYYDMARITITSQNNITSYDFSFVNNVIGQPIIKSYNKKYLINYACVNLEANEKIRQLIPKSSMTYKAFDLKRITEGYISWYIEHLYSGIYEK